MTFQRIAGSLSQLAPGGEPGAAIAVAVIGLVGLGLAVASLRANGLPRNNPSVTFTSRNADREASFRLSRKEYEDLDFYRESFTSNSETARGIEKLSEWWLNG